MEFDSVNDILKYYRKYGNEMGFPVKRRSSKKNDDGVVNWVAITCGREGKTKSKCKNSFKPQPICRTNCDAKVNAVLCIDGKWRISSVSLEHNHLLSPGKSRYYKTSRVISSFVKRRLEMNDRAGIPPNKNFNACVVEAGGNENVPFLLKDCYNYINKVRKLRLGDGDAVAVQNYFLKMQQNNDNFFYSMDWDDDGRVKNLFWADARSRAAYKEFGDAITFDTTYLTNKYDMPFAPFVGVNHHGQSILLGCGLILNEDTDTFTWLFKTWLVCMNGRALAAIITDQDRAMKNSIEVVFPNSRHRWCLWHIMKKLPEKLRGYSQYESIKFSIQYAVYDSLSTTEFETSWIWLIEKYNLGKNEWLSGLYNERHRWVPTFVKDTFWAGMSTTQRSESMNAFFDGYVTSRTTLKQFVEQYENALRTKAEKESQADYGSFNASIPCVTKYKVEKQFQECYTTEKFKEFQNEIKGKLYCNPLLVREDDGFEVYKVTEYMVGETERQVTFTVLFALGDCDIKCNCRLFKFRGIVCRHCLTILINVKKYHALPEKYILRRWRKDVKRCHTKVKIIYSNWAMNPENERADRLCNMFNEVVNLASENEDKTKIAPDCIKWLVNKLKNGEGASTISEPTPLAANQLNAGSSGVNVNPTTEASVILRSPLAIRRKGRPPSNRRQRMVEKAIKRKREKMSQGSKSTSHVPHGSKLPLSSQSSSTQLDTSHCISTQASPSIMQDFASGSVPCYPLNISNVYYRKKNPPQVQACWNGVYDRINDPSNEQGDSDALWNLSNQHFDPFWRPKDN